MGEPWPNGEPDQSSRTSSGKLRIPHPKRRERNFGEPQAMETPASHEAWSAPSPYSTTDNRRVRLVARESITELEGRMRGRLPIFSLLSLRPISAIRHCKLSESPFASCPS